MLIKMQGRYSGAARQGVMRGFPCLSAHVSVSDDGCAELVPTPPPTIIEMPRARMVLLRQAPSQHAAPPSRQGHSTSRFHTSDSVLGTVLTKVVLVEGVRFVAIRMLSLNWHRLNQDVPRLQYTWPVSDIVISPQSRVWRSAHCAENGPPIGTPQPHPLNTPTPTPTTTR